MKQEINTKKNKKIEEIENLLPRNIKDFAEKNIYYSFLPKIPKSYDANAFCYYISKKYKSVIFIYPIFWKYTKTKQIQIIFHEIAHVYLHLNDLKNNEIEANKLARTWNKK